MKVERIAIVVLASALMLTLGVRLGQAQWSGPPARFEAHVVSAPAAAVWDTIAIQGRLTDAGGNPLTGNYSITASIYDVSTGGTARCSDNDPTVTVTNGLFNMNLDGCVGSDINGDRLWLGIKVGADAEMTPRVSILAVPYAYSLRPGAVISGTVTSDATVHAENSDPAGRALRGYATSTTGTNYGIVGRSYSPDGYGGYFGNDGGGTAIYAEDDVRQARAADGLVKAGAYVYCASAGSLISRSFNNVNSTAITISNGASTGKCTIDFGFDVSDRYVVAIGYGNGAGFVVTFNPGADNEKLDFEKYDLSGAGSNGNIMIIIY